MKCGICACGTGKDYTAREMMFGTGDEFPYFECSGCGCVQLASPPPDLARYYPANYYSFNHAVPGRKTSDRPMNRVRQWCRDRRNEAQILGLGGLWGVVARMRPLPGCAGAPSYLRRFPGLRFSSRVMDVGCGDGLLLAQLAGYGFRNLTGVDPFLPADSRPRPGVRLLARAIHDVCDGPYDLIMFHHSLEHIPDQQAALGAARRLLGRSGHCFVRVPVACSNAWQDYRTHWVELDAPRHFFLHTQESMARLAEGVGLRVVSYECDPDDGFNYWGSEMYRRGIPLMDSATGRWTDPKSLFSEEELAAYRRRAESDCGELRGGRGMFILCPA
jgi:SAM-dependent methyltransferase